jgi:cysteinyl-tRNA synthetase
VRAVKIMAERLRAAPPEQRRIPVAATYASLRGAGHEVPRERESFGHGRFGANSLAFVDRFLAAMDEDVGCPQATAAMFDYVGELFAGGIESCDDAASVMAAYRCLTRHLYVLGVELPDAELYPELAADCMPVTDTADATAPLRAAIDRMLVLRAQARAAKDFARADLIRDLLKEAGVKIEDTPGGARWELA